MALTQKQDRFCIEIVRTDDRNQAYRAAFNCSNMKQATIDNNAYMLLQRSDIKARIAELKAPVIAKTQLTLENVLQELMKIAFVDIRKVFNADGCLKPVHEWDDNIAGAVTSVEVLEVYEGTGKNKQFIGYSKKVKFNDKNQSLDKLMKHLGAYEKDNKQKGNVLVQLAQALQGTSLQPVSANIIDIEDFEDDE